MRKGFSFIICCILTVLLSSCSAAKTAPPQTVRFFCDFVATYGDLQLEGTVERLNVGTLTLSLSTPQSLSGMQLSWDGEKTTVAYRGLTYTMPSKLPQTAAVRLIAETLDDACKRSADATWAKDGATFTGVVGTYGYRLQSDATSGTLLSLEVPDAAFSVRFFNTKTVS